MSTLARDGAKTICSRADLRLLQGETKDGGGEEATEMNTTSQSSLERDTVQMPAVLTFSMCVDV